MKPTRPSLLLASIALLAAAGCQGGPLAWTLDVGATAGMAPAQGTPRTMGPNVSLVAPVAPRPSAKAPTATPAPSQVPSSVPLAIPSFEAPEPDASLPPPQTYGDVEPAEREAVEQAIATDVDLAAYLPSELIHDGGVVLYRLAQLTPVAPGLTPPPPRPNDAPRPPLGWSRETPERSGAQLTLKKECPDGVACLEGRRPVRATVEILRRGVFVDGARRTPFGEIVRRELVLRPEGGKLVVDKASPLTAETRGGRIGLEFVKVHLLNAQRQGAQVVEGIQRPLSKAQEPKLAAGQEVVVEVQFAERLADAPYVYVSQADGKGPRIALFDDGFGDDLRVANGTYSGRFVAGAAAGLHHLKIEVVSPRSFEPGKPFRGLSVAIPYRSR